MQVRPRGEFVKLHFHLRLNLKSINLNWIAIQCMKIDYQSVNHLSFGWEFWSVFPQFEVSSWNKCNPSLEMFPKFHRPQWKILLSRISGEISDVQAMRGHTMCPWTAFFDLTIKTIFWNFHQWVKITCYHHRLIYYWNYWTLKVYIYNGDASW